MFNFFLKSPFIQKLWEKPNTDLRSEEKGIPWCLGCGCRMWLNLSSFIHPSISNMDSKPNSFSGCQSWWLILLKVFSEVQIWYACMIVGFEMWWYYYFFWRHLSFGWIQVYKCVYSSFCLFLLLCMLMCVSC